MWRPPLAPGLLWQSWLSCWLLGLLAARWPGPALCAGLCVLVADSRLWRFSRLLLACAVALLGCATARALLPDLSPPPLLERLHQERIPTRHWPVLEARVDDVRTLPDLRLRISLTDLRLEGADGQAQAALPGDASWTWEQAAVFPLPGQTVRLQRKLLPVDGQRNFGLTDWGFWWHSHGTGWRIWSRGTDGHPAVGGPASSLARQRLALMRRFLAVLLPGRTDLLPPPAPPASAAAPSGPSAAGAPMPSAAPVPQGKAILLALLFGERFLLETPTVQAFNAGNLSHSLALSGQHLLVAGLAGMFVVWMAARLHPGLYLWRPRSVLIPLAACPAALVYLWLGNAPPSLLRAAGMLLLLATGMALAHLRCMPLPQALRERLPASGLDVLCCTLLCITVISPLSVFDTGLQLSALCVAVICCATPLMGQLLRRIPRTSPGRRLLRSLAGILLVSFFIQLALLPLSLLLFNNSGLWFLLNVFWLPVLGALVLPGAFLGLGLSLCGLAPAAALVLDAAALPCQWLVDGLLFLQAQGWLSVPPVLRPHWTALPPWPAFSWRWPCGPGAPPCPRRGNACSSAACCWPVRARPCACTTVWCPGWSFPCPTWDRHRPSCCACRTARPCLWTPRAVRHGAGTRGATSFCPCWPPMPVPPWTPSSTAIPTSTTRAASRPCWRPSPGHACCTTASRAAARWGTPDRPPCKNGKTPPSMPGTSCRWAIPTRALPCMCCTRPGRSREPVPGRATAPP